MRIDLGAKVQTKDGDGAGRIKQAIWDPRTNKVTAYVIDTGGLLGHQVVVSPETLEGATRDGDAIVLDMLKPEFDELARYEEADYEAVPLVGPRPPDSVGRRPVSSGRSAMSSAHPSSRRHRSSGSGPRRGSKGACACATRTGTRSVASTRSS